MKMVVLEEKFYGFCFSLPSHEKCVLSDFVRSGRVDLGTGALRGFGIGGNDWSGVAAGYAGPLSGSTKAYDLSFNASGVYPSANYVRWYSFPVRCLVY